MAQTKKKRQRKRRGTQGGRIDNNPRRAKPRNRAEAQNRARAKRKPSARIDLPPTWRSSIVRGLIAGVVFTVFLLLIFKRSLGASLALGAFMLAFYIPAGYFIDMTLWRRRERARFRAKGE